MKIKALATTLILGAAVSLAGCSTEGKESQQNDKLKIYTTIFPLQDFTKKIGGNLVEVETVYPPNTDAHSFEPTTKKMIQIAKADAFIYTGAGIEGFADKAAESLKNENVEIVKAAEGIKLVDGAPHTHEEEEHSEEEHAHEEDEHSGEEHSHSHGDKDPHVWLDPVRSIEVAEQIKNVLVKKNPEGKDTYEKNFADLKSELEKLDKEFQVTLAKMPKKEILVSHAAYGYWDDRYGIKQISVLGLSPSEEPSQKQMSEIIEKASAHNIKYLIFEKNVTSKISKVVQDEIGASPLTLSNLESVTEDDIQNKEDYFSLMRKNLDTLKTALK